MADERHHDKGGAAPMNPPAVADVLRTIDLRCGYILGACKGEKEMRLEAEEIKRLVASAQDGLRAWWHGPEASAPSATQANAEPSVWSLRWPGEKANAMTTFSSKDRAEAYAAGCGTRPEVVPLYEAAPPAIQGSQKPVATLHSDGHWTHPDGKNPLDFWSGKDRMEVFAAPVSSIQATRKQLEESEVVRTAMAWYLWSLNNGYSADDYEGESRNCWLACQRLAKAPVSATQEKP